MAAACALLLVAGAAWFSRSGSFDSGPAGAQAIVSAPARQVLPDGSVVELRDDALIAVDFAGPARRVILHRGEAYFQVARNPARPFVVAVDGIEFRAVGTAFSVQRGQTQIELLVTEGRVAVEKSAAGGLAVPLSPPSAGSPPPPQSWGTVDAGSGLVVELAPQSTAPAPVATSVPAGQLAQRLAWRIPLVEFNFTPLSEVILTFNRYGDVRLVLADPALGKLKLSGVLRADNTTVLLRILETSYELKSRPGDSGETVIHRGP